MSKKKTRHRLELIDIAKAITIFLVILGHTSTPVDAPVYMRVLYSFHMPLFFFLAGMSIKPAAVTGWQQWRGFLKKNTLALVVPYLIWGLIYAPFSFEIFPKLFYASWPALGEIGTLTSLWYLSCFFIARILTQIVISLMMKAGVKRITLGSALCALPPLVIGFLLPQVEIGYPWCFNIAFTATGFILLGIALRDPLLILAQQKGVVLAVVFGISISLLICGTILRGDSLELALMCNAQYGSIFWFLCNSVSGSVTVLSASMILARIAREGAWPFSVRAVTAIGQDTMGIFLLHKNMLQQLILPGIEELMSRSDLLSAFLASCVTLAASILLCYVIKHFVPQLLGRFPKYAEED